MNKTAVYQQMLEKLAIDLDVLQRAAQTAYEAATHEENIAENKYDTLGLEASYLATGQARRVEEIRQALKHCQTMTLAPFDPAHGVQLGALVKLEADNGSEQWLLLAPDAAGLKLAHDGQSVTVITPRAPLGAALIGKQVDDEVQIKVGGAAQGFIVCEVD
ncbi:MULTISPECIES: GreA/GreB family elongation factor [unclassified Pseudomonas]|uniref:GreA/GreB family elongation factor n=1 Tax=unclassified Pseudomonas TaxID=196821 RepID=UPI00129617ED|nr:MULTISPECIES: GreA/GreB family elongation factor [unclassified Pseudomonas]MDU7558262.1 GreA/GreB family elongation factor [Pseudomonas sp.]MQT44631.1 transcription elongation factor GreAB [Pseudomonas sp. FSL R10-0765]MQT51637.1 transcription elongation factor GreAB [Pseudomonas sp. FSL R10-2398]MQU00346.1 transcription elongation factor GreAB [Pseudomonas sp. FSL R10-2245]MQU13505.1 transcription elongation factor GreAB [Pseudomonas sp. FSL R10-2189]